MASILDTDTEDQKQIETESFVFHSSVTSNKRKNTNTNTPNQKRRKINTEQWKSIFTPQPMTNKSNTKLKKKSKKKSNKQKKIKSALPKVIKDTVYKASANKFMDLPTKKKLLLMKNSIRNDAESFDTMAENVWF